MRSGAVCGATSSPVGNFFAPNILNTSFETGWEGWVATKAGSSDPGTGSSEPVALDNTTAAPGDGGAWSVKRHFITSAASPGGDIDGNMFSPEFSPHLDRAFLSFYFKINAPINSVLKFVRFSETNLGYGGFELDNGTKPLVFWTDQENQIADHFTTDFGVLNAEVYDSNWHCLELDYWRNGDPSGFPSAAFWFDGVQRSYADGVVPGNNQTWFWSGGRLNSGERNSSLQLAWVQVLATLNGGQSGAGDIWVDRIRISSLGRIGT